MFLDEDHVVLNKTEFRGEKKKNASKFVRRAIGNPIEVILTTMICFPIFYMINRENMNIYILL